MTITSNIDDVIRQMEAYRDTLKEKKKMFLEKLALIGINTATVQFQDAKYDGENDVFVSPTPVFVSENTLEISATGHHLLFIEFGSGVNGVGHQKATELGYGPGTWSDDESKGGKGHWNDPNGWYYEHGKKSWGNQPAEAMWQAGQEMRQRIIETAKEVFGA